MTIEKKVMVACVRTELVFAASLMKKPCLLQMYSNIFGWDLQRTLPVM
jgi:hypothetical protein